MPNARNLRPWKKGHSGNPSGRPKQTGPTLKDWQAFAVEPAANGPAKDAAGNFLPTRDDTVMRTLYLIAIDRRHRDVLGAIKEWANRVRGKSPNKLEVGARGDFDAEENPISTVLEHMLVTAKAKEAEDAAAAGKPKGEAKRKRG